MASSARAVFLDRDGTLNVDTDYVHRADQWEWIPGAIEAIRGFNRLGLIVIVVTNQAGVARGYYGPDDVDRLHRFVGEDLARRGARVDAFYFCPHHPEAGPVRDCLCRKPRPGMLLQARQDHGIDLSGSFMVGDKAIDVLTGRAAGAASLLVRTGYGRAEEKKAPPGTPVVDDVKAAFEFIERKIAGGAGLL